MRARYVILKKLLNQGVAPKRLKKVVNYYVIYANSKQKLEIAACFFYFFFAAAFMLSINSIIGIAAMLVI